MLDLFWYFTLLTKVLKIIFYSLQSAKYVLAADDNEWAKHSSVDLQELKSVMRKGMNQKSIYISIQFKYYK